MPWHKPLWRLLCQTRPRYAMPPVYHHFSFSLWDAGKKLLTGLHLQSLARLHEIGRKCCILLTYCRQEDATFFSPCSHNLVRFFVQTSWVGGLSRVWKNALSITPNRVSISFITKGAEPADSLNITVLLSEQPILRHGRRAVGVQEISAENLPISA